MVKQHLFAGALFLISPGVSAVRNSAAMGFCETARCNGYSTDGTKRPLDISLFLDSGRGDVEGYHSSKLVDCKIVTGEFSYEGRNWADSVELNYREGLFPSHPGDNQDTYTCAEVCKLQVLRENGELIEEKEVGVEREGKARSFWRGSINPFWRPSVCKVDTPTRQHWWKQKLKAGSMQGGVMEDPTGLPVYPSPFAKDALKEFKTRFCLLSRERKARVVSRVTRHRLNRRVYGHLYYGQEMIRLQARNFFPYSFPYKCVKDGLTIWTRQDAEGVVRDEPKRISPLPAHNMEPQEPDDDVSSQEELEKMESVINEANI